MADVVIDVLVMLFVLFLLAVGAGVLLVRRGARTVRARAVALQPRVQEARVMLLPPGSRRSAAELRAELAAELCATRDLLAAAPQGLVFRADAQALLRDIDNAGRQLDVELHHIERFRDAARRRAALDAVRPQVRQLIATAYSARETVLQTAAADRERSLDALQGDVSRQAAALQSYRRSRGEFQL